MVSFKIDTKAEAAVLQSDHCQSLQSEVKSESWKKIAPKRLALSFDVPTITLEYLVMQTGKLYHHKIKIRELRGDSDLGKCLKQIKRRHEAYLADIDDNKLLKLLALLRERCAITERTEQDQLVMPVTLDESHASSIEGQSRKDDCLRVELKERREASRAQRESEHKLTCDNQHRQITEIESELVQNPPCHFPEQQNEEYQSRQEEECLYSQFAVEQQQEEYFSKGNLTEKEDSYLNEFISSSQLSQNGNGKHHIESPHNTTRKSVSFAKRSNDDQAEEVEDEQQSVEEEEESNELEVSSESSVEEDYEEKELDRESDTFEIDETSDYEEEMKGIQEVEENEVDKSNERGQAVVQIKRNISDLAKGFVAKRNNYMSSVDEELNLGAEEQAFIMDFLVPTKQSHSIGRSSYDDEEDEEEDEEEDVYRKVKKSLQAIQIKQQQQQRINPQREAQSKPTSQLNLSKLKSDNTCSQSSSIKDDSVLENNQVDSCGLSEAEESDLGESDDRISGQLSEGKEEIKAQVEEEIAEEIGEEIDELENKDTDYCKLQQKNESKLFGIDDFSVSLDNRFEESSQTIDYDFV